MLQNQKLYTIIAQSGTCTHNAAQIIVECLYAKVMNTLLKIPKNLQKSYDLQEPLLLSKDYNFESLFTNISIQETFDYIMLKVKYPKYIKISCLNVYYLT